MVKYWLPFLIAGIVFIGSIAYAHSREVEDTLLAIAVFAVISIIVLVPSQPATPGK